MKQLILILAIFFYSVTTFCQTNSLQEGKNCFETGDYSCAILKFNEAVKTLSGKDKQIAEINFGRAQSCSNWLKTANQAFNARNYKTAKENYQFILDENPKDEYAKAQIEKCDNSSYTAPAPSLRIATAKDIKDIWDNKYGIYPERYNNLINAGIDPDDAKKRINNGEGKPDTQTQTKQETTISVYNTNLSFPASGGRSEQIKIYTNADNYGIFFLPAWCSSQTYNGYFIITCTPNTSSQSRSDWFKIMAGDKDVRVNISQQGVQDVTLSTSKTDLSFSSSGGNSEQVKVSSIVGPYSISLLPSWCTAQTFDGYFIISCTPNTSSQSRSDWFNVKAGEKVVKMNINQQGGEEITLSTSIQNVSITKEVGSMVINVNTNANDFNITLLPSWCKVNKYRTWFSLNCEPNLTGESRSDWFYVNAGEKQVKIIVNQSAVSSNSHVKKKDNPTVRNNYTNEKCFNCPKTKKDTWGLTVGYNQLASEVNTGPLNGTQLGLRIEPLFKYGFGLNTGILFEAYFEESASNYSGRWTLGRYAINIPLHLEYRLNFSREFNLFGYGGVGLNGVTNSSFSDYTFPITIEYGGGFRSGHIQFNAGQSLYLGDFRDFEYLGNNTRRYHNFYVSISYMF
jgi:hypothetical protein